jgi:hypothetical protein
MLLAQSSAAAAATESPCPYFAPGMQPGVQLINTAAECHVAIPFNASSGTTAFNVSLSFLGSSSADRFTFRISTGAETDSDKAHLSVTGNVVEVQAEAVFSSRDIGSVIPLCAVIWMVAASPSVNASFFHPAMTRMQCVLVVVQPCLVCGRRSVSHTASTLSPPISSELLMALNLNTIHSLQKPSFGFSVSPPAVSRQQRASSSLPELRRTHASHMSEGQLLQTGIAHTIIRGDSLAAVAAALQSTLTSIIATNPGLPMNASAAGAGSGDYALIEGAMLCVQPQRRGAL